MIDDNRSSSTIEKRRKCWELFKCSELVWRDYMKQNNNGEKWLLAILVFQILFIIFYVGMDSYDESAKNLISTFDIFNTAILLWLIVFCFIFLYNGTKRLMISELKIAIVCFGVMNVYMSMRYALSLVYISQ